jgi:hypothetical protein
MSEKLRNKKNIENNVWLLSKKLLSFAFYTSNTCFSMKSTSKKTGVTGDSIFKGEESKENDIVNKSSGNFSCDKNILNYKQRNKTEFLVETYLKKNIEEVKKQEKKIIEELVKEEKKTTKKLTKEEIKTIEKSMKEDFFQKNFPIFQQSAGQVSIEVLQQKFQDIYLTQVYGDKFSKNIIDKIINNFYFLSSTKKPHESLLVKTDNKDYQKSHDIYRFLVDLLRLEESKPINLFFNISKEDKKAVLENIFNIMFYQDRSLLSFASNQFVNSNLLEIAISNNILLELNNSQAPKEKFLTITEKKGKDILPNLPIASIVDRKDNRSITIEWLATTTKDQHSKINIYEFSKENFKNISIKDYLSSFEFLYPAIMYLGVFYAYDIPGSSGEQQDNHNLMFQIKILRPLLIKNLENMVKDSINIICAKTDLSDQNKEISEKIKIKHLFSEMITASKHRFLTDLEIKGPEYLTMRDLSKRETDTGVAKRKTLEQKIKYILFPILLDRVKILEDYSVINPSLDTTIYEGILNSTMYSCTSEYPAFYNHDILLAYFFLLASKTCEELKSESCVNILNKMTGCFIKYRLNGGQEMLKKALLYNDLIEKTVDFDKCYKEAMNFLCLFYCEMMEESKLNYTQQNGEVQINTLLSMKNIKPVLEGFKEHTIKTLKEGFKKDDLNKTFIIHGLESEKIFIQENDLIKDSILFKKYLTKVDIIQNLPICFEEQNKDLREVIESFAKVINNEKESIKIGNKQSQKSFEEILKSEKKKEKKCLLTFIEDTIKTKKNNIINITLKNSGKKKGNLLSTFLKNFNEMLVLKSIYETSKDNFIWAFCLFYYKEKDGNISWSKKKETNKKCAILFSTIVRGDGEKKEGVYTTNSDITKTEKLLNNKMFATEEYSLYIKNAISFFLSKKQQELDVLSEDSLTTEVQKNKYYNCWADLAKSVNVEDMTNITKQNKVDMGKSISKQCAIYNSLDSVSCLKWFKDKAMMRIQVEAYAENSLKKTLTQGAKKSLYNISCEQRPICEVSFALEISEDCSILSKEELNYFKNEVLPSLRKIFMFSKDYRFLSTLSSATDINGQKKEQLEKMNLAPSMEGWEKIFAIFASQDSFEIKKNNINTYISCIRNNLYIKNFIEESYYTNITNKLKNDKINSSDQSFKCEGSFFSVEGADILKSLMGEKCDQKSDKYDQQDQQEEKKSSSDEDYDALY